MNENIIAIIQARGGSKGVPKKNIRNLGGFPLIAYSITACNLAKKIERTIISTDSTEIAEIARRYGAEVPFYRPDEYATDKSTDREVIEHAISWFRDVEKHVPLYIVQIRPTTPFREPNILDDAIIHLQDNPNATSLTSVHQIEEPPGKMFGMQDSYLHGLCPFDPRPEYFTLPRQAFPPTYFGNGYVDIIKTDTLDRYNSCYGPRMLGFITPDVGEVDCEDDFRKLEYFLNTKTIFVYEYLKEHYQSLRS